MKRQTNIHFLLLSLFLGLTVMLQAQVNVEGKVNTGNRNILMSVYSTNAHQLVPIAANGEFFCRIPRYEECVLVFYEVNSIPKIYSINTDNSCQVPIKLNVNLDKDNQINIDEIQLGPEARYVTNGSDYNRKEFNLDVVHDKAAYASAMSRTSSALDAYYKRNVLPVQEMGYSTRTGESELMKTEHKLGQEIYQLLVSKRSLQSQLDQLNANYTSGAVSANQQCNIDITLLKKEASFYKTDYDLATKQLDKEKLIVKRKETVGKTTTNDKVRAAEKKMNNLKRKYEIAALNMKNKQADCWELKLHNEIEAQIKAGRSKYDNVIKLKQLDISDVRYRKRLDNALKLMKHHNALANDLTGRDRVVELANAQKYISEIEQVKLYRSDNVRSRWKYKDDDSGKFQKQREMAQTHYKVQQERAFQAEMAYLEHIWHLRGKPEVKDMMNDLFNRHNDLLAVQLIPKKEELEEIPTSASGLATAPTNNTPSNNNSTTSSTGTSASTNEINVATTKEPTDEELLSMIQVSESSDADGQSKTIKIEEDSYEIKVDANGRKTYIKNGKPITRLTYQFETKRKFGEILENVTLEDRKSRLLDLLKKKTN